MEGPHFAANPIGVEYDPEEMLARLRSGTPGSAFLPRHDRPAGVADPLAGHGLGFGGAAKTHTEEQRRIHGILAWR